MIVDWLVKAYRDFRWIAAALAVLAVAATPILGVVAWSCVLWFYAGHAIFDCDDAIRKGRDAMKDYVAKLLIWLGIGLSTGGVIVGFSCIVQSIWEIKDLIEFTFFVAVCGAAMSFCAWLFALCRVLQAIIEVENQ